MKKVLATIVLVCSFALLVGCGSNKIVGKWEGATEDGLKTTFTFEKKNVVKYQNEFGFNSEGTYSIKDDKITISLKSWSQDKVYTYSIKDGKLTLKASDQFSPSYKDMKKVK